MMTKILNAILIVLAVYMGFKQGSAMLTGEPAMLNTFSRWHFSRLGVSVNGVVTLIGALLMLHPRTFFLGNFLVVAAILLLISLHLSDKNPGGVVIELPFFLLHLLILYLQHPLAETRLR